MIPAEYLTVEPNVVLHVRDWGEGRQVVFLPGWPFGHEMFEYQFIRLPRQGLRCIGISPRGFGRSSQPMGEYGCDLLADDLKTVLEQLELKDVVLIGFGLGASVALRYMGRHGGERVSRLALCGAAAPCLTSRSGFSCGLEPDTVESLMELCEVDRPLLNYELGNLFFHSPEAASPGIRGWLRDLGMQASPHATYAALKMLKDLDLRDDMARVQVPTAVFHGVHDRFCPLELAEVLTAAPETVTAGAEGLAAGFPAVATGEVFCTAGIPGARLVRYENSGHALFYEERDKFSVDLANFVHDRLPQEKAFVSESVLQ